MPDDTAPEGAPLPALRDDRAGLSPAALEMIRAAFASGLPVAVYEPDGAPVDAIEEARRWEITDEGGADWAMRHYAAADARIHEVADQAARWREQIDQWERDELAVPTADVSFFGDHLTRWGMARRWADLDGAASFSLPSGTVKTARRKPDPRVVDKDALIAWCREHRPDLVESATTYNVTAAAAKTIGKIVTVADPATGEAVDAYLTEIPGPEPQDPPERVSVPGVAVEPERVTVELKPTT